MKRSCGECSACCYTLGVEEIKKDSRTSCVHQCTGGGCAIYNSKPESCTHFMCAWLEEIVAEAYRPDKTNIVVYSMHESRWEYGFKAMYVTESIDHACESENGKALLRSLLADGWTLIVRSYVTKPILQWYVNLAVLGIESYIERLLNQNKAVVSMAVPLATLVVA